MYGSYVDEPIALINADDELFYYHRNNLYSVAAISNATGAVVERYYYDAYGVASGFKGMEADFNQDGTVDYVDLGIWSANAFNQGTFWEGDANGDGTIDYTDLEIWSSQAFKTQESLPPANFTNPYTFTGRRYDPETGLYYYRARYYDPKLGRFISRDPIGFEGSKWNLYEYVDSNPTNMLDPTGLRCTCSPGRWVEIFC